MYQTNTQVEAPLPTHPEVRNVMWDVKAGLLFLATQQKYEGYCPERLRLMHRLESYLYRTLTGKDLEGLEALLRQV